MARTDIKRYDETLLFLRSVDQGLALDLDQQVSTLALKRADVGRQLSLDGIWSKGHLYRGQHEAMRALLLLHNVYLQPPYARQEEWTRSKTQNSEGGYDIVGGTFKPFYLNWQLDVKTSAVRNMSNDAIKDLIRSYAVRDNARVEDLALVAEGAVVEGQSADYRTMVRSGPTQFGSMCVCYDAVRAWLFKAGFASMRWLAHEGPSLIAMTANRMLGDGVVVPAKKVNNIPRGWIFNFHGGSDGGRDNKDVCHWGVSLGNGLGAATNTTDAEQGKRVNFIRGFGPARYGVFRLDESFEVCRLKYGGSAVIRQIDPSTVPGLY